MSKRDVTLSIAGRRHRPFLRCAAVLGVFAALLVAGCNNYSPNLGVAPTQASEVSSIYPTVAPVGSSALTLTVNGLGFVSGSTVLWNQQPRATTFVNAGQLTATITAADLNPAGTLPITAQVGVIAPGRTTNNTAGDNLSNFLPFVINPPNTPVPTLTQISPSSATVGGPAFNMTLTGTGFASTSVIYWSGFNCITSGTCITTNSASATQIVAQVPAAFIAAVPTLQPQVSVYTPGGGTTGSLPFTITTVQSDLTRTGAVAISLAAVHSTAITAGPRFIAFVAASADSAAAVNEIFLQGTCAGAPSGCTPQTTLVSVPAFGTAPDGNSDAPSISSNGRFVAFASAATNLVPGDNDGVSDIFLRDTCIGVASGCTPTTTLLSVAPDGSAANGASAAPSISPDGRYVSFDSVATNLVAGDSSVASSSSGTNSAASFLRDTCIGATGGCTPSTARLAVSASQ